MTIATLGRWVKVRMHIVSVLLTLGFFVIVYQAYGLQVATAARYRELAQRQHLRMVEVPAPRGPLLDTKGRELAVTADADSVFANPREVVDLAGTADTLATMLELDLLTLEAKLAARRHFVWLKRHVTAAEARAVRAAGLKGIYITQEPRRYYPGKDLAGPVLGFAGIDGSGLDGIELKLDDVLVGEKARFPALRDASGRVMLSDGLAKPRPGATVTLTIDRAIQYIADRALQEIVAANQAKAGSAVVLDVRTGEVLAMANYPSYDPNAPARARSGSTKARNRVITDSYEIGSVMKVFTMAAALDAGVVDTEELIDVEEGTFTVGRKVIRDTYRDFKLTVGGIIKRSSNVGAVKIAQRLGKETLHKALLDYGFGSATGIELPGEQSGTIHPPARWGEIGLASVSFGYGMTVTSLQVAAGIAAIGNRGVYVKPRLIRQVKDATGTALYEHRPTGRRIISEKTATSIWPMLASVFEKGRYVGTAHSLESPHFAVGGKTGTARKVDPATRQYSTELYISSFAGLAPIDDPRIAVVVVVDEPHGDNYYGGQVAGPAFVRIADETLRYLGVPAPAAAAKPADPATAQPAAGAGDSLEQPERAPPAITDLDGGSVAIDLRTETMVPDFVGMGMRKALEVGSNAGLTVEVEGSGRAERQFPPPGPAPRGSVVRVFFSQKPQPAMEAQ